jgi:predicted transcriptional regulator
METPAREPACDAPRPTDAELEILRVLWRLGPCSVRQVHAAIHAGRDRTTGTTTTLKLMQIMHGKRLLTRDDRRRPQVYACRLGEAHTQRQLLRDLLARAFGGSHRQLVLQALADRRASEGELAEIEALLDRLEEGRK